MTLETQVVGYMDQYYVYILTNRSGTLYIGVTNDLIRRIYEHKHKLVPGFTSRYNIDRLIYYEAYPDPMSAIQREKTLKGWRRDRKVELVKSMNAEFRDLADDLLESPEPATMTPAR